MSDYQNDVQKLVEGFVGQLSELWRRAVADSLNGLGAGAPARRGPGRPRGSGASAVASSSSSSGGGSRRKGEKRTGDELDKMADQFHDFVMKNPGLRIEQINKELGTTTKDLALPIKKLIADGMLKGKGEKRSRTYFGSEGKRKKSS